jgi:hypothetical protein
VTISGKQNRIDRRKNNKNKKIDFFYYLDLFYKNDLDIIYIYKIEQNEYENSRRRRYFNGRRKR